MPIARNLDSHERRHAMQQFPTRSSSNRPLLFAAIGIGALAAAYALSSPRRRSALIAAGESALEAGSRFAATSAEKIRDVMPQQAMDTMSGLTSTARSVSERATTTAADKLHDAVDRATELMQDLLSRMRKLPDDAQRRSREEARDVLESGADAIEGSTSHRGSGRGVIIAAAAIGAGIYAMQRYGASDRVRQKLGADESGTITVEKSIFIAAPVEQVFDTWSKDENFPRFMSNVKKVVALEGDRSRWTVRGPAGVGVEFDSVMRKQRPNELSWESVPGSTVENEGRVTLVPDAGGTLATVRMSYRPPGGSLGQAVSSMFGANPKQELEEDLGRMKQFIEGQRIAAPQSV
jgi:uncharacterized membrane protein